LKNEVYKDLAKVYENIALDFEEKEEY